MFPMLNITYSYGLRTIEMGTLDLYYAMLKDTRAHTNTQYLVFRYAANMYYADDNILLKIII